MFSGGYIGLIPVVLADMFGQQMIAKSFGIAMLTFGVGSMLATPIGGISIFRMIVKCIGVIITEYDLNNCSKITCDIKMWKVDVFDRTNA